MYGVHSSSSVGQLPDEARLGLPAQSQQNEIVPREQRVDHLRHHRILVADDARETAISPRWILQIRFLRISSLTLRCASFASEKELVRSAPRVRGNS